MNTTPTRSWQSVVLVLVASGLVFLALSGYLTPLINTALDPLVGVQRWVSIRYMAIYEFLTVPRDVATLRQRNAELEAYISGLETEIIDLENQLRQAEVIYALLDFSRSRPENEYTAASVIGRDTSPYLQYIFIDHGSDDGIRHGMPVVNQQGLIGRVDAVYANVARVQLITDAGARVNVSLQSVDADGILTGSVTGDIILDMVPQNVTIETGDLVLTSGLGGTYPPDVVAGQVLTVRKHETDLFQTATIQPAVDFQNLQAVLIITNYRPLDIAPLQPTQAP
jgi:rod shape-determining protein MreC